MALVVELLPAERPDGIPSVKQLLDGSASVTFGISTFRERLYGAFTTDSSGIDSIAFGRVAKSKVTLRERPNRTCGSPQKELSGYATNRDLRFNSRWLTELSAVSSRKASSGQQGNSSPRCSQLFSEL